MHKDLNAVKGGYSKMAAVWRTNGEEPPISLLNRDKAAARLANPEPPKSNSEREVDSDRGAVGLAQLVGALVNHKDDKKGYHNIFRHFCHSVIQREVNFPDTNNTRYQCYCKSVVRAAAIGGSVTITRRPHPYREGKKPILPPFFPSPNATQTTS